MPRYLISGSALLAAYIEAPSEQEAIDIFTDIDPHELLVSEGFGKPEVDDMPDFEEVEFRATTDGSYEDLRWQHERRHKLPAVLERARR